MRNGEQLWEWLCQLWHFMYLQVYVTFWFIASSKDTKSYRYNISIIFPFLLTVILCTVSLSLSLKSDNNNTYRLIPQIIFSNSIHSHLFFNEKLHQLLVKIENVLIIALFLINNNENISSNFHLRHTCLLMSWLHTKLNFLNLYCNWRFR